MQDLYKELCELVEKYKPKADAEPIEARWEDEPHDTLKLNCGIEIALDDYWEMGENGNKKTAFTFDEASEIEKKTNGEWRVPTVGEWCQICVEISDTLDRDVIVTKLKLTEDEYGYGSYWSSAVGSSNYGYGLVFDSGGVYPQDYDYRDVGFSVRLIKGDK